MMEATGNLNFHCGNQSRGVDTVQTNIHYGPPGSQPPGRLSTVRTNSTDNYAERFHIYELEWTEQYLAFIIGNQIIHNGEQPLSSIALDGTEIHRLRAPGPEGGLWEAAGYSPAENIYRAGGPLAPFDTEFYFILSAQSGSWLVLERPSFNLPL